MVTVTGWLFVFQEQECDSLALTISFKGYRGQMSVFTDKKSNPVCKQTPAYLRESTPALE